MPKRSPNSGFSMGHEHSLVTFIDNNGLHFTPVQLVAPPGRSGLEVMLNEGARNLILGIDDPGTCRLWKPIRRPGFTLALDSTAGS